MQRNTIESNNRPSQETTNQSADAFTSLLAMQINRRAALQGLSAIGALFLAACNGQPTPQRQPQPRSPEPTPTSQQIIENEIKKLGIQQSQTEKTRWEQQGYQFSSQKVSITPETIQEAQRRVQATLRLMEQSENPYFKNAADFLKPLLRSEEVSHEMFPQLQRGALDMATAVRPTTSGIQLVIGIDINHVLNSSNSIILATGFTHEAEHIKNQKEFLDSLNLPTQEKLARHRAWGTTERVAEEARGYGMGAKAFVYEYGLLGGYKGVPDQDTEIIAAKFIEIAQNDINNPNWRAFVNNAILRNR